MGRHRCVDICHADVFPAPILKLFLDQAQRLVHVGDHNVHAHNVAGVHQMQVGVAHAAHAVQLAARGHKIVVDRHRRDPQVVAVRQQHDAADLGGVLHILHQYQRFDAVVPHDPVQVLHGAAVIGQGLAGGGGQIAAVPQRHRAFPAESLGVEPLRQLPAADQQRAGGNVVPAHIGIGGLVKGKPLAHNDHDGQKIIVHQQQAGELIDPEGVEHGGHQRQTGEVCKPDKKKLLAPVLDMQRAISPLDRIASHIGKGVQPRHRQEGPDIPHAELAADGAERAQHTSQNEHSDEQYKFSCRVQEAQQRYFMIMHDGPPYGRIVTIIVPYTSMIFNTQHKAASFLAVSA